MNAEVDVKNKSSWGIPFARIMAVLLLIAAAASLDIAYSIGQRDGFTVISALWGALGLLQLAGSWGYYRELRQLMGRQKS